MLTLDNLDILQVRAKAPAVAKISGAQIEPIAVMVGSYAFADYTGNLCQAVQSGVLAELFIKLFALHNKRKEKQLLNKKDKPVALKLSYAEFHALSLLEAQCSIGSTEYIILSALMNSIRETCNKHFGIWKQN